MWVNAGLLASMLAAGSPSVVAAPAETPRTSTASFTISGIMPVRCSAELVSVTPAGGGVRLQLREDCNTSYRLNIRLIGDDVSIAGVDTGGSAGARYEGQAITVNRLAFEADRSAITIALDRGRASDIRSIVVEAIV